MSRAHSLLSNHYFPDASAVEKLPLLWKVPDASPVAGCKTWPRFFTSACIHTIYYATLQQLLARHGVHFHTL